MTGVRIVVQNDQIQGGLGLLLNRLGDLRPFYEDIGELLLESTRARFDSETDPDGNRWVPLSARYAASKRKQRSPKILRLEGNLYRYLTIQASSERLLVGSDEPYAAIQQKGGQVRSAQRASLKPRTEAALKKYLAGGVRGLIPARPYLGLSSPDIDLVQLRLSEYLGGGLG